MIHRRPTIPANKIPGKRKTSITAWRKDVEKYRRCQPKGPPLPPSCSHSHTKFECSLLVQRDLEAFHRKFYYTRNKAQQDAFILRHCQGRSPRRKSSVVQKERKLTVEYFVPGRERNVQVCKEAFVGILRVNKSRVNALLKSFYKIDHSKDNPQNEQESSRMKGRCKNRGRKNGKDNIKVTKDSKSFTNIDLSTGKDFSTDYISSQPECEKYDKIIKYSISMKEKISEEKQLNHQSESNRELNIKLDEEVFMDNQKINNFRVNPLLKSFYNVDNSKDSSRDEQESSKMKGRSLDRKTSGEEKNDLAFNSKSLTNIEHSTEKDFPTEYRTCQSDYDNHDEIISDSVSMEEKIQKEKNTNQLTGSNSVNEDNLFEWLNLYSEAQRQRAFNWSSVRQTPYLESNTAIDCKTSDSSRKNNISQFSYIIPANSNSNNQNKNICKENSVVTTGQTTLTNPNISLTDQSHVYESKKRKMRKLECIDGKENMQQIIIKNKYNNSKPLARTKIILVKNNIDRTYLLKRKDNEFGRKMRFPLQRL